ncbi:hypothetical protein BRADI_2g15872v3 [Brachypodium distachyon]|uniref:WRKY domain-containing protein n=1 Tax=Brachypodium distachyon TaxID=15368 RepID=A0A0Q3FZJ5_BRADI|nr:hypothetical protein BRADI_2g15872v3 [Brachypodium distachyon]
MAEDAYWWRRRRRGGLATELDRLLEMARELEVRVERGSPATARDLCAALAASVDNAVRLAGTGTPRGGGAIGGKLRRKRGAMEKVRRQVRVSSVHDLAPLDDGLSWRKYGQKDILGAKYPRAYLRCTHRHSQGCQATKQVQRDAQQQQGSPVGADGMQWPLEPMTPSSFPSSARHWG